MSLSISSKLKALFVTGLFSISSTSLANALSESPLSYQNEKAITFETMDGKTTNAFEGFIEVPENRAQADSRMIKVSYVRFPATGNKKGSPIIYLSGGPGGSGIMTAKYPRFRFPLFMALREFGDVIALDQRGTGAAKPALKCSSQQSLPMTKVISADELSRLYHTAANECVDTWQAKGIDIQGYTTQESARDINALREHFDAEKVTLWGISYGSHLALASIKSMQGKIDKLVIASAEGLNQTVKLPARTDAYFARLQQAINTQPQAKKRYPDIIAMMQRVHEKLDDAPKMLTINRKNGSSYQLLFQKAHLQMLASGMISDPHRGVTPLLALYHELDNDGDNVLKSIVARGYFDDKPISFDAMSFAMDIASGITDERLAQVNEQAKTSLLGTALNFPMPLLNKAVAGLDLGDDFRTLPKSDVPTLLLTGTLDGRTYVEGQLEATQGLSNLTQVTVANAGHNLFMSSPKVTQVIKEFLQGEQVSYQEIEVTLPSFYQ